MYIGNVYLLLLANLGREVVLLENDEIFNKSQFYIIHTQVSLFCEVTSSQLNDVKPCERSSTHCYVHKQATRS